MLVFAEKRREDLSGLTTGGIMVRFTWVDLHPRVRAVAPADPSCSVPPLEPYFQRESVTSNGKLCRGK